MTRLSRWTATLVVSASMMATTAMFGHAADTEEEAAADKIEVVVLSGSTLNASGVPVSASLEELADRPEGRGLERVILLGQARSQESELGTLGQVVWYGLKATVGRAEKKAGLRSPLKSAFITPSGALPTETRLQAEGDTEGLIDAARALLREPARAKEEDEGDEEDKDEGESRKVNEGQVGGGAAQNPVARAYTPAPIQEASGSSFDSAQMESMDGCSPRVDLDNGVVYPTSKLVTVKDGAVTAETACSDAGTSFPLQWSTAACDDEIDLENLLVYPHVQGYYVGDDGLPVYVSECARQGEREYVISRDDDICPAVVDLAALTATLRYQLVYTDARGAVNVAQACKEDPEKVVPVQQSFAGCSYRHENDNGISFRQSRFTYITAGGEEKVVSGCVDSGEPVLHEFDIEACNPAVDMGSGTVIPLARRQITTAEGVIVIAGCAPMEDLATGIVETVAGCEGTFDHDIPAGVSYPTSRYYYELEGARTYVTDCEVSDADALEHQYEAVDWQFSDPSREATPVERIYINTAVGEVEVAPARIRAGVVPVPYTFVETAVEADLAARYWEGCNAYTPQNNVEIYERPDTTQISYVVSEGDPSGPVDECQRTPEYKSNQFQSSYVWAKYHASTTRADLRFSDGGKATIRPGSGKSYSRRVAGCTVTKGQGAYWKDNYASFTRYHLVYPDGSEGQTPWAESSSHSQQHSCNVDIDTSDNH